MTSSSFRDLPIVNGYLMSFLSKHNILKTYRLVASGRRQSGSPHSECHTKTPRPALWRDRGRNILKLVKFNGARREKDIKKVLKRFEGQL